jgi:hypothetical protein
MPEVRHCPADHQLENPFVLDKTEKIFGLELIRELARAEADQAVAIARINLIRPNTPLIIRLSILEVFLATKVVFGILNTPPDEIYKFEDTDACREYFKAKLLELLEITLQDAS